MGGTGHAQALGKRSALALPGFMHRRARAIYMGDDRVDVDGVCVGRGHKA
jgi:hypothetical protein